MQKIILKDIIDSSPLLTQSGEDFYQQLSYAISSNEKLVVDMSQVSSLPSIFLNVSIGRLIDEFGTDTLKRHISFISITRQQALRMSDYIAKYNLEPRYA